MINTETIALLACISAAIALVAAESRHWQFGKVLFKCLASTAFVVLALQCAAFSSVYGRLIVIALGLSWIGDMLLLSQRNKFFLSGICAFLVAHLAFAVAFASRPINTLALGLGLILMSAFGLVTLRWLWAHLSGFYKLAVTLYVIAIVLMCSLAISASVASGFGLLAAGALAFAASDISVARDRFVAPGVVNRAWGLPLYYAAQLMLAWSVCSPRI